jgi:hypothetical protein
MRGGFPSLGILFITLAKFKEWKKDWSESGPFNFSFKPCNSPADFVKTICEVLEI